MKFSKSVLLTFALILVFISLTLTVSASPDAEITVVTSENELNTALSSDGFVRLGSDVTLFEMLTVPEGVNVTLDLFGFTLSTDDVKNTYALNNLGSLTVLDSVGGGEINSRGVYNGYDEGGSYVYDASLTVKSGTYNAKGTNGGAAIFNCAKLVIDGGKFTSVGVYSINTKADSVTVINNGTVTGGIYNLGNMTVNGGDISNNRTNSYAVYNSNATLVINGGTFENLNATYATVSSSGSSSVTINDGSFSIGKKYYVLDGVGFVINGGSFSGGMRCSGIVINGGTFSDNGMGYRVSSGSVFGGVFTDETSFAMAEANLADGCILNENGGGTGGAVINCKDAVLDGAKYNLTTMTSFIGNFYLKVPEENAGYRVNAENAHTYVGITEIDGADYYAFTAASSVADVTSEIVFDISADFDGNVINLSVGFTTDGYFADVMLRYSSIAEPTERDIESMALVMNAARYANELYKYSNESGEGYEKYEALLSNEDYAKYLITVTDDTVSSETEKDVEDFSGLFSMANLKIISGYSANYAFYLEDGVDPSAVKSVEVAYTEIGGAYVTRQLVYDEDLHCYEVSSMPIYDMLESVSVKVTLTDGAQKLGTYNLASYVINVKSDLGYALYAYAMASKAYKIN